jgi:hypothetical protein
MGTPTISISCKTFPDLAIGSPPAGAPLRRSLLQAPHRAAGAQDSNKLALKRRDSAAFQNYLLYLPCLLAKGGKNSLIIAPFRANPVVSIDFPRLPARMRFPNMSRIFCTTQSDDRWGAAAMQTNTHQCVSGAATGSVT